MSWLDPARRALDEADRPRAVFFRLDDAGWRDDRLAVLLDRFGAHGIVPDIAVIPAALNPGLARQLGARARSGRIRLHQHGLAHVNHEPTGRKCEFGASRGPAAQEADIRAGRRRLLEEFGEVLDPVFTPPWNRCASYTGAAVARSGLTVLSRDLTAPPLDHPGLVEIPVTLDWFVHHKGVRWPLERLGAELAEQLSADRPVGVMLHHAITDRSERELIDQLLALAASHPAVRLTTIAEIASVRFEEHSTC